jgi:hypothetical protein
MPKYEVPIVYTGQCNFIVEASSPDEAREIASSMFNEGERPDILGNEWERIERIGEIEPIHL